MVQQICKFCSCAPGPEPVIDGVPYCECDCECHVSTPVNHPMHYGGAENTYEAIKVIEAWGLGFCLGNTVKYIARAERKGAPLTDLEKAAWYLNREIQKRKQEDVD